LSFHYPAGGNYFKDQPRYIVADFSLSITLKYLGIY
jgi:hypothetical protein